MQYRGEIASTIENVQSPGSFAVLLSTTCTCTVRVTATAYQHSCFIMYCLCVYKIKQTCSQFLYSSNMEGNSKWHPPRSINDPCAATPYFSCFSCVFPPESYFYIDSNTTADNVFGKTALQFSQNTIKGAQNNFFSVTSATRLFSLLVKQTARKKS